jgi:transposase
LYESTSGTTVRAVADDLGVERGTLRHWLELYGTGKKTAAAGTLTTSPLKGSKRSWTAATAPGSAGSDETPGQRIARLEASVVELEASEKKLTTEREILRSAAKYFAGETRW